MDIAVSYHDTPDKLQGLDLPAMGPFDRLGWYALLERPLFVLAERGKDRVVLPLQRGGAGLTSLTNWFSFTWRPIGRDRELLETAARELRRRTHEIDLAPLPPEDGSADLMEGAFRAAGWMVFRTQCDENHVLPLGGRSFAGYWAQRPGRMRTTLKRKAKKVEVEIFDRFDEGAWSEYQTVYAQSWKPGEERADILEAFARTEGEAGRTRIGIARAGGVAVAAQFWTVDTGTAYIHKLAHVEEAVSLSAGTTLSAALFRRAIDTDGVAMIDFGTGTDAYKRDWMEIVRPRYRLTCFDWRQPRAWFPIIRSLVRHLAPHNRRS